MAEDLGERTEAPTPRRRQQARERGQVAKSQDVGAAAGLAMSVVLLVVFGGSLVRTLASITRLSLSGRAPGDPLDPAGVFPAARLVFQQVSFAMLPIAMILLVTAWLAGFVQVGPLLTLHPVKPNLKRLNPASGIKRVFGMRGLARSIVNGGKLVLVGVVAWLVLTRHAPRLVVLPRLEAIPAMAVVGQMALELAAWLLAILLVLAVIDFLYQKWQHTRDLRMTKHDVKDERRSLEGDPQVKKRRMKMAMDIAMHRVGKAVPEADVVVTNPTHFSVALRYDSDTMRAPRVVAKGADMMAFRIRHLAVANGIPLVERPPLARGLFWGVDVGQEVPPKFYEAVAEILAYVYRTEQTAAA